jgi:phage shock protein C
MVDLKKRLYRSKDERMLAGVCGGLGEYLEVDPTVIRLAMVLLAFAGGPGIIAYIVLWIVVPERPRDEVDPLAAAPADDESA